MILKQLHPSPSRATGFASWAIDPFRATGLIVKDICCNPRLHDLVLARWPPCCATSFVAVVVVVRHRRRWAHAPVIHAASHFDHKKRVAWVPISMHTCASFFYNYGAPLGGPSGRRSSAIMHTPSHTNLCKFLNFQLTFSRLILYLKG